jgi:hypothetical protein
VLIRKFAIVGMWVVLSRVCTGMLSKSLGQILRVSVAMHVLFWIGGADAQSECVSEIEGTGAVDGTVDGTEGDGRVVVEDSEDEEVTEVMTNVEGSESGVAESDDPGNPLGLSNIVSKKAMKAAIDFVQVCCQHTAHIAGRGSIADELTLIENG